MLLNRLCAPALTYLIFVLINIISDILNNKNDNLISNILTGLLFIIILQVLCEKNLRLISWLLVFIPLIMYTYTTIIIFSVFGLNPKDRIKHYIIKKNNNKHSSKYNKHSSKHNKYSSKYNNSSKYNKHSSKYNKHSSKHNKSSKYDDVPNIDNRGEITKTNYYHEIIKDNLNKINKYSENITEIIKNKYI